MPVRKFSNGNDVEWFVTCEQGIKEVLADSLVDRCGIKKSMWQSRRHLEKDFSDSPQIKRFGFTNPKPFLVFSTYKTSSKSGKKYSLRITKMIHCDQGCLSACEVAGTKKDNPPIPTPEQIRKRAKAIRRNRVLAG